MESSDVALEEKTPKLEPFYLNLLVQNSSEVVAKQVDEKVGKKAFGLMNKAAKFVATSAVSEEKISGKIVDELVSAIPPALDDNGIQATCQRKWLFKNYIVCQVDVLSGKYKYFSLLKKHSSYRFYPSTFPRILHDTECE